MGGSATFESAQEIRIGSELEITHFRREGQICVEPFVEDGGCVARAGDQFCFSPLRDCRNVLYAKAIEGLDNPEVQTHLAQPYILFLRRGADLFRSAGQKFEMAGLNLARC